MITDRAVATLAPDGGTNPPAAGPRENMRPHVTVRGLSKRFNDAVIYDRFDLDIPRGKLISVFGPNGCGKSTLINMIAGLIPADAGQILFDGQTINEITFGFNQTMWRNPRYGAINVMGQYEWLQRSPWLAVAPAPKATHDNTIYFNVRYTLPGSMPNF